MHNKNIAFFAGLPQAKAVFAARRLNICAPQARKIFRRGPLLSVLHTPSPYFVEYNHTPCMGARQPTAGAAVEAMPAARRAVLVAAGCSPQAPPVAGAEKFESLASRNIAKYCNLSHFLAKYRGDDIPKEFLETRHNLPLGCLSPFIPRAAHAAARGGSARCPCSQTGARCARRQRRARAAARSRRRSRRRGGWSSGAAA